MDTPTTVSFVAINRGETQPDHLTRFDLLPLDWNELMDNPDDLTLEEYQALTSVPLRTPAVVYYLYDPNYAERPESITCFWFSGIEEQWMPHNRVLSVEKTIAISTDVMHWGSYTIAKNFGLGGPPRIPP